MSRSRQKEGSNPVFVEPFVQASGKRHARGRGRTILSGCSGTGSARLGALQPYIETSVEKVYDLPATTGGTETAGSRRPR